MTLATTAEIARPRRVRLNRAKRFALGLDALLMAGSLGVCIALITQGGLEAAFFAIAGALISARKAPRNERLAQASSGGFAGLFVGALFAAFFHNAFVGLVQLL
ncbi:MAG: hypothetical protein R3C30_09765 [Hyphomonadaceae bacterium]